MSARRLGVEQIDLYYLHSGYAKDASFEDQVGTLAELRQQGLIRHIGLSNVTSDQLRAARQIVDIAAVTAHFNVVARQEGTLLDAALEAGAVFVPWQPVSLTAPGSHRPTLAVRRRSVASSSPLRPGTGRPSRRSRSLGYWHDRLRSCPFPAPRALRTFGKTSMRKTSN